jgi:hypothetical protein
VCVVISVFVCDMEFVLGKQGSQVVDIIRFSDTLRESEN